MRTALGEAPGPCDTDSSRPMPHEIASETLFHGRRVVVIRHGEDHYRLQITGTGKLILTK